MDTFIFLLKAILVLGINIGFGYIISICFHFYFFYPRKIVWFNRYHLWCTPGFTYRRKAQLIEYLKQLIDDYFDMVKQDFRFYNQLTKYETRVYKEIYPYIVDFCDRDWIPQILEDKINELISNGLWFAIRKFSRSILPSLLNDWQIYTKLDLLDLKLDIKKLEDLFNLHFYRYFRLFNICFFAIVGILNMILFLILA